MRPDLDTYLLTLAKTAAGRTTCIRRGVGCVLADEKGRVLAISYNGVASGMPHCNEHEASVLKVVRPPADSKEAFAKLYAYMDERGLENTRPGILKIDGDEIHYSVLPHVCPGHDLPPGQDRCEAVHAEQNALVQCARPDDIRTAYVTLAPCLACTKLLLGTGCRRICFTEDHTGATGKELWTKAGRAWSKRPAG